MRTGHDVPGHIPPSIVNDGGDVVDLLTSFCGAKTVKLALPHMLLKEACKLPSRNMQSLLLGFQLGWRIT